MYVPYELNGGLTHFEYLKTTYLDSINSTDHNNLY